MFFDDDELGTPKRKAVLKATPPTPETGWRPPTEFPNLTAARMIGIDCETKEEDFEHGPGWARDQGHIVGVSLSADDGYGNYGKWYFPVRHEVEPEYNLSPPHVFSFCRDVLERTPHIPKVGANLTYDVGWLAEEDIIVRGEFHDVQFAEALLSADERTALDALGFKYLQRGKTGDLMYRWQADAYGGAVNANQRANIYRTSPRLVGYYAEDDAVMPLQIIRKQWPFLEMEGLLEVYRLENDLIPLMIAMRRAGVSVDIPAAERLYAELGRDIVKLDAILKHELGFELNCNAAKDIARAFDYYGLKYPRTAAGAPSFTKDFLKVQDHPIGAQIIEKRMFEKTRNTFLKAYLLERHHNGKIHATFTQLRGDDGGTGVGRFASQDPNLQNVSVRPGFTEEKLLRKPKENAPNPFYDPTYVPVGKRVRSLFKNDPGHLCWQKDDFSQIQYRGLVHYAVGQGAEEARAAYNANPKTDYHDMVQNMVHSVAGLFIERKPLKNINFGLAFGMGVKKLMRQLGVSQEMAEKIIKAYFLGAPYVKDTMDHFSQEALKHGELRSMLGRKVRFNLWEPVRRRGKQPEERPMALPYDQARAQYGSDIQRAYGHKAMVLTLQMMEGDTIKRAMRRAYHEGVFDVTGVPRITVHDELGHSVRDECPRTNEAYVYMKYIMETATPLKVPVLVDTGRGPNWGSIE